MNQVQLFLASQSPRRKALLEQIGVKLGFVFPSIAEIRQEQELPEDYVQRLSCEKALAGLECVKLEKQVNTASFPVLGADTIVVTDGDILEKPQSKNHAVEMLLRLSGSTHSVLTAVTVASIKGYESILSHTRVRFRTISESEACAYWQTGEPADKAGSYAVQGLGAVFVESIEGSYSGVVGLPLKETADLLRHFDVPVWTNIN